MSEPYLEVTFRHGRPLAAYYYLPRRRGDRAARTKRGPSGLVIDYARGDRAIGIEITAPSLLSLAAMNRVLRSLGQVPVKRAELSPVLAAPCGDAARRESQEIMKDHHINIFWSDEDAGYIADIPDLEACSAFGATPAEALAELERAKAAWLEAARLEGRPIPVPKYRPEAVKVS